MRGCACRASHLTNDAVQKTTDTYNAHEDHCKMSMDELQAALGASAPCDMKVRPTRTHMHVPLPMGLPEP